MPPWLAPGLALGLIVALALVYRSAPQETAEASTAFTMCTDEGQRNCVIDGDTFRLAGERIRIEDIDAPEIFRPKCSQERAVGIQAKQELLALLNDGKLVLARYGPNGRDAYGRKLWTIERQGSSLGQVLVGKGLARPGDGPERDWCQ